MFPMYLCILIFAYLAATSFQKVFCTHQPGQNQYYAYKPSHHVLYERTYNYHQSYAPPTPSCAIPGSICTHDFRQWRASDSSYGWGHSYSEGYAVTPYNPVCCNRDICNNGRCCTATPSTAKLCTADFDCCGSDVGVAACDSTVGLCKVPITQACTLSSDCLQGQCVQGKCCYTIYPMPTYVCRSNDECCSSGICGTDGVCRIPLGGSCTCANFCVTGFCVNSICCSPTGGACNVTTQCCVGSSQCDNHKCCISPSGPCTSPTDCCVANSQCPTSKKCCSPPSGSCSGVLDCCVSGSLCRSDKCCSTTSGACSIDADCCGNIFQCKNRKCCNPASGSC